MGSLLHSNPLIAIIPNHTNMSLCTIWFVLTRGLLVCVAKRGPKTCHLQKGGPKPHHLQHDHHPWKRNIQVFTMQDNSNLWVKVISIHWVN